MNFFIYFGAGLLAIFGVIIFGYGIFNDDKWYEKILEILIGITFIICSGRLFGFW